MGVEYELHLLPRKPSFRPSAERIARYVRALVEARWLLAPRDPVFRAMAGGGNFSRGGGLQHARKTGAMVHTGQRSEAAPFPTTPAWLRARKEALWLEWPFEDVFEHGLRFPVSPPPFSREYVWFSIEIRWSRYFLQLVGDGISSPPIACSCGASLDSGNEIFFLPTFQKRCSSCGTALDPARYVLRGTDYSTNRPLALEGGGLHRFAVVLDCGKCIPEDVGPIRAAPELTALCAKVFGQPFVEVGVFK